MDMVFFIQFKVLRVKKMLQKKKTNILKHPFQRSDKSNSANPTGLEQAIFKRSSKTMENSETTEEARWRV